MYSLVYVSSAVVPFTRTELHALLADSRERNDRAGLTGMLLYKDGNLMQALEGEREAVLATFARISRDPRHRGIMVLVQGEQAGRRFVDWSMGFRDLSAGAEPLAGFSEVMNTAFTGREFAADPSRAERLLLSFKRSM